MQLLNMADLCTAVIINYQTPDLTVIAIRLVREYYPGLPILLIDNGSRDDSRAILESVSTGMTGPVKTIFNASNIHHGPAMDLAVHSVASPYILFLDSDCQVRRGGFLEKMISQMAESANYYAVGKKIFMDRRGFDISERPGAIPYIRPICMLLRREYYLALPPFRHHGAPCLENMKEAARRGLGLLDFPIADFVDHLGRGTAGRYGYQLGWRGKMNHLLHKLGL